MYCIVLMMFTEKNQNELSMKYLLTIGLMMTLISAQAQSPQALYPGEIPNYIAGPNTESAAITGGILRISNVTDPVYTVYLAPENQQAKKPLVIIFPGGGYRILAARQNSLQCPTCRQNDE